MALKRESVDIFQSILYPLDKSSSVIGLTPIRENSVKHTFELLEVFTVEAAGMSQVMEHFLSVFAQYDVGKVVIFVNYQIERIFLFLLAFYFLYMIILLLALSMLSTVDLKSSS